MPNTFSQIYIQIVFAVHNRNNFIYPSWENELFKYMTGIIRNKEQKLITINGVPNHIYILIGMKLSCCLSDLMREVKKSSNEFVNEQKFLKHKFRWQEGLGAFSYSHSILGRVIRYIENQMEHHKIQTCKDEYHDFLKKFEIDFKDQYLFNWLGQGSYLLCNYLIKPDH